MNNLIHFNWYELAEIKVSYVDGTSNLAERRNRSLKNHWQKAPFCRRNIDICRESRNWFSVYSYDHLVESPTKVRVKNCQKLRREQILKLLQFQFENTSCTNSALFSFMKGLKNF